jgi:hypothetical protein
VMSPESLEEEERRTEEENAEAEAGERKLVRYTVDGLSNLGGLVLAAGVCGTNTGDLRRSLDGDGRRLCVLHAMKLGTRLARFNPSLATRIASAFVHPFGLEVFPRVTLTDKERADRLEAAMRAMPMGPQLLEQILSGGRR